MKTKGFELAISTLVLLVLGIVLLAGLIFMVGKSLGWFDASINPYEQTGAVVAIREACNVACQTQDRFTYCCKEFTANTDVVTCRDARLEVSCGLTCEGFNCAAP